MSTILKLSGFFSPAVLERQEDLKVEDCVSTGASLVAQWVKNLPAMREIPVRFLGQEDPLEKDRPPSPVFWVFPGGSRGFDQN